MNRLSYLDSSRGLASLAVLLAHFQLTVLPQFNDSWIQKTPLKLLFDGEAAVLYFFILSGYVLTMSIKKVENPNILLYAKFILKRIFRIYPAFIFTLFASFLLLKFIPCQTVGWLSRYWTTLPDFTALIKQALLIVRLPNDPLQRILPHDWTLSIEMAVSILLPFLAIASKKSPWIILLFSYSAIKFLHLDPFVWDFSLGIFIAQLTLEKNRLPEYLQLKIPLIFITCILLFAGYIFPEIMKLADKILIHHKSWGLAILLYLLLSTESFKKLLSFPPLTFLGKISYSFYLLHLIILYYLNASFTGLNAPLFLAIYLSVTSILASITYYLIEKPFISFGKQYLSKSSKVP